MTNEAIRALSDTLPLLMAEAYPLVVDPYCDPKSESDPNPPIAPQWNAGGATYKDAPMISVECGLLLYSLIRHNKCRNIVETGTCYGNSSSWMAGAIKDNGVGGMLTTFDVKVEDPNPQELWNRVGVSDYIRFINGEVRYNTSFVPEKVDFAFIDSQHNLPTITAEMDVVWPRLVSGGLVVFHDYTLYPECKSLLLENYCPNLIFKIGRGLLLGQKR